MLFKKVILTEDEFDAYNETPEDVADDIIQNNQTIQQQQNYRTRDFSKEFSDAKSTDERAKIVDEFINEFSKANNINVSTFRNSLKSQLLILGADGLNQSKNPYLTFLTRLNSIDKTILSALNDVNYGYIIRLVSDSIINEETLLTVNKDSILVVKDLYSKPYNEIKYYCQCFYYLNDSRNSSTIEERLNNMNNQDKEKFFLKLGEMIDISKIYDNSKLNSKQFCLYILFINGSELMLDNIVNEKLRPAKVIEDALSYLDTFGGYKQKADLDDIDEIKPSDKAIEIFNKSNLDKLDKDLAKELIAQLLQKYKLTI